MKKRLVAMINVIALIAIVLCCAKTQAATQVVTPSDCLILQGIGNYHSSGKGRCGNGAGLLGAAAHFSEDHIDTTCRTGYYFTAQDLAVSVQVTKHAGSDSDKWLLHELDIEFRNYYGKPGYYLKTIDGNIVYVYGAGGRDYRWLSGNKVVMIEYHDAQLTKPEPVEVIQAYLVKHPSTIPAITMNDLNSAAKKTAWIKDEMDRRLWLCDKWFLQITLKKAEEKQVYQESVKSMNIFLDYREKYFGVKAMDDKNLLAGYLNTNNGTGIKTKLTEYKNWWTVNKAGSISL